jgi:hypothetical protein
MCSTSVSLSEIIIKLNHNNSFDDEKRKVREQLPAPKAILIASLSADYYEWTSRRTTTTRQPAVHGSACSSGATRGRAGHGHGAANARSEDARGDLPAQLLRRAAHVGDLHVRVREQQPRLGAADDAAHGAPEHVRAVSMEPCNLRPPGVTCRGYAEDEEDVARHVTGAARMTA